MRIPFSCLGVPRVAAGLRAGENGLAENRCQPGITPVYAPGSRPSTIHCEWENRLAERQFARIGRTLIINLSRVRAMTLSEPYAWELNFNNTVKTLKNGAAAARGLRKILSQISQPLP